MRKKNKKIILATAVSVMAISAAMQPLECAYATTNTDIKTALKETSGISEGFIFRFDLNSDLNDWILRANLNLQTKILRLEYYGDSKPNSGFSDVYMAIQVTRNGETIYERSIQGDETVTTSSAIANIQTGDIIKITHKDANTRVTVKNATTGQILPVDSETSFVIKETGIQRVVSERAIENKIEKLFVGQDTTKDILGGVTQDTIDEIRAEINNLTNNSEKERLADLLNRAEEKWNAQTQKIYTKELDTLVDSEALLKVRIGKGLNHDRQDIGIILPADTKLKIRQTNPLFTNPLKMRLTGKDQKTDREFNITSEWIEVSAKDTLVPYIFTPHVDSAVSVKPVVEYQIDTPVKRLPIYEKNQSQLAFYQEWNDQQAEFAMIKNQYFQLLIPLANQPELKYMKDFSTIDELIAYYEDIFGLYNKMTGLSFDAKDSIDQNTKDKYFMQSDLSGIGYAYYGHDQVGLSNASSSMFVAKNWGLLHEIGHGYQIVEPAGFSTGEVWNNIYAASYERKMLGDDFVKDSWLYDYGKLTDYENELIRLKASGIPVNDWGLRQKLIFLMMLDDKAGEQSFINYNKSIRELAMTDVNYVKSTKLWDFITRYYGKSSNYDFTPVIDAAKGEISDSQRVINWGSKQRPVSALSDVVTSDKLAAAKAALGLENKLSVVDNSQLEALNLKGDVALHIDVTDFESIRGEKLLLTDGGKQVKEIVLTDSDITVSNLPNGTYKIKPTGELADRYVTSELYLVVKNGSNAKTIKFKDSSSEQYANLMQQTIEMLGDDGDNYMDSSAIVTDLANNQIIFKKNEKAPDVRMNAENVYFTVEVKDTQGNVVYTNSVKYGDTETILDKIPVQRGYKIFIKMDEQNYNLISFNSQYVLMVKPITSNIFEFTVKDNWIVSDNYFDNNFEEILMKRINRYYSNLKYTLGDDIVSIQKLELLKGIQALSPANEISYFGKIRDGLPANATLSARAQAYEDITKLFVDNDKTKALKVTTDLAAIMTVDETVNALANDDFKEALLSDVANAKAKLVTESIAKPIVMSVTNNDTQVKGTGTPGLTIVVDDGTDTYTDIVAENGVFAVTIPLQKADKMLTITQKNASQSSNPVTVKVSNYIPDTAPVVNPIGPFQQAVTGIAPVGTKMVRLLVNGIAQRTVAPAEDGSFSIYSRFITNGSVATLRLKAGDNVTVDYGNKTSANKKTTVTVDSELMKPIVDAIAPKADYITGLVPIGTQVLRLVVNGKAQRTITPQVDINAVTAGGIGFDGHFKIYSRFIIDENGVSRRLQAGDRITIDAGIQIPGDTGTTVTVAESN
ncbi:putative mucin/carbohydrate-binding domain-containing protein [Listeria booriae]|uniref:putative mucin/carbohydrate-binding domain-containing protein n=1 Tax=Listeria booriae TaxID=1552123 RepID=UPI0016285893|nr:putative mucin/carbohydrate-binding domain-containing protein [Listeria booriae]MBC2025254.1 hypothetical protein [Listeria booriae]